MKAIVFLLVGCLLIISETHSASLYRRNDEVKDRSCGTCDTKKMVMTFDIKCGENNKSDQCKSCRMVCLCGDDGTGGM